MREWLDQEGLFYWRGLWSLNRILCSEAKDGGRECFVSLEIDERILTRIEDHTRQERVFVFSRLRDCADKIVNSDRLTMSDFSPFYDFAHSFDYEPLLRLIDFCNWCRDKLEDETDHDVIVIESDW